MKSSLFLVAASALLASAGPLRKRAMETDWVYEVVTVTVTAGQELASVPTAVFIESKPEPTKPVPTKYTPPPPPPVPTVTKPKPTKQAPPPPPPPPPAPTTTTPVVQSPPPPPQPTANTQPANPPATNLGNYEQTILDQHNIHRRNHSAPDLTWDSTLAQYAANTANTCVFAHDMKQGDGAYGQNLAAAGASNNIDGLQVKSAASGITNQWYNGEMESFEAYYGQANPSSSFEIWGHFTQVVWKSTTKVGCATVQCPINTALKGFASWYTVCNYDPQGNFGGEYGNNVLKPRGDATVSL